MNKENNINIIEDQKLIEKIIDKIIKDDILDLIPENGIIFNLKKSCNDFLFSLNDFYLIIQDFKEPLCKIKCLLNIEQHKKIVFKIEEKIYLNEKAKNFLIKIKKWSNE